MTDVLSTVSYSSDESKTRPSARSARFGTAIFHTKNCQTKNL